MGNSALQFNKAGMIEKQELLFSMKLVSNQHFNKYYKKLKFFKRMLPVGEMK